MSGRHSVSPSETLRLPTKNRDPPLMALSFSIVPCAACFSWTNQTFGLEEKDATWVGAQSLVTNDDWLRARTALPHISSSDQHCLNRISSSVSGPLQSELTE
jgi:hypothetical protein